MSVIGICPVPTLAPLTVDVPGALDEPDRRLAPRAWPNSFALSDALLFGAFVLPRRRRGRTGRYPADFYGVVDQVNFPVHLWRRLGLFAARPLGQHFDDGTDHRGGFGFGCVHRHAREAMPNRGGRDVMLKEQAQKHGATAAKAGELNDFSVCTTWGVLGEKYYLINVMRRKLDYPELQRLAIDLADAHRPDIVLVEAMGTGTVLSQELHRRLQTRVWGLHPRGDKVVRFAANSFLIEQGRVYLPEQAPWLDTFVAEQLAFPGAKHDDQVDSVEMFLRYIRRRPANIRPSGRPNPTRPQTVQRQPGGGRPRRGSMIREDRRSPNAVSLYIPPSL